MHDKNVPIHSHRGTIFFSFSKEKTKKKNLPDHSGGKFCFFGDILRQILTNLYFHGIIWSLYNYISMSISGKILVKKCFLSFYYPQKWKSNCAATMREEHFFGATSLRPHFFIAKKRKEELQVYSRCGLFFLKFQYRKGF